jgi:hypothetical protein
MTTYTYTYASSSSSSSSSDLINEIIGEFPGCEKLSSGFSGTTIGVNDDTVMKIVVQSHYDEGYLHLWETFDGALLPAEMLAMEWANSINSLVVQFVSHTHLEDMAHLIAMERLYPCVVTAFTRAEIQAAIDVAESELKELWASGWAHGDLRRPDMVCKGSDHKDPLYNNIMLVKADVSGCVIRLIDTGLAVVEQYDEDDELDDIIEKDMEDWQSFKHWVLNYPR